MIKGIIQMLNKQELNTNDEHINIALGKYKAPETWEEYKHFRKIRKNGRK